MKRAPRTADKSATKRKKGAPKGGALKGPLEELVVVFGPGGRDMDKGLVEICSEKLSLLGARVEATWVAAATHLVASPFASEETIAAFVDDALLDGVKVVPFAWAKALATGGGAVPDASLPEFDWQKLRRTAAKVQAREQAAPGATNRLAGPPPSEDSSADVSQAACSASQDQHGMAESDQSWLARIPPTYAQSCAAFMAQGEALGIKLPRTLTPCASTNAAGAQEPGQIRGVQSGRRVATAKEDYMAFRSGSELVRPNLNEHITRELERLEEYYKATKDSGGWKANSYKKAIDILKGLQFRVVDASQVASYRGIGPKLRDKIDEVIRTGRLAKADNVANSEQALAIKAFTKVHGIASESAMRLYAKGMRTIEDLRSPRGLALLTRTQTIGLQFYEDLQERISRDEVRAIGDFVMATSREVWPDKDVFGEVVGSYRRGKETCGDVDMIFTTADLAGCPDIEELLSALHRKRFLVADLTKRRTAEAGKNMYGQVKEKQMYMGICRLPSGPAGLEEPQRRHLARRIDIKIYPREMFAFALIYFTGNDHFNRSLRHYCKVNGMSLSDEGLFATVRDGASRVAKSDTPLVQCLTEQEVFEHLGFPYKAPNERNCTDQGAEQAAAVKQWRGSSALHAAAVNAAQSA